MDSAIAFVVAATPFVASLTALVVAVGAIMLNYLKGRAAEKSAERAETAAIAAALAASRSEAEIVAVGNKVFALGKQLDGQLSKLLAEIKAGAYAKGRLDEAADGQVGHKVTNGDPPPDKT